VLLELFWGREERVASRWVRRRIRAIRGFGEIVVVVAVVGLLVALMVVAMFGGVFVGGGSFNGERGFFVCRCCL